MRLTTDEMLEFVRTCERLPERARCFEGYAVAAARLHDNNLDKVTALLFRLRALVQLITTGRGAPGWTLPEGVDGTIMTEQSVIAAAAVEPLTDRNGLLVFRRQALLRRALQLRSIESDVQ